VYKILTNNDNNFRLIKQMLSRVAARLSPISWDCTTQTQPLTWTQGSWPPAIKQVYTTQVWLLITQIRSWYLLEAALECF